MGNLYRSLLLAGGAALLMVCCSSLLFPSSPDERPVDGPPAMAAQARQRSEAKREVALAVGAGRLTLTEAVARFRAIDATAPPEVLRAFRTTYPADSDEERYRRVVIQYVTISLADKPEKAKALRLRLETDPKAL